MLSAEQNNWLLLLLAGETNIISEYRYRSGGGGGRVGIDLPQRKDDDRATRTHKDDGDLLELVASGVRTR